MKTRLTAISFALAMAAAIFLLAGPVYSTATLRQGSGAVGPVYSTATLLQVNGARAVRPVVFPVLVALMPLLFRKQAVRVIATVLMGGFVIIGGFSIGLFYLPAAIAMLAACSAPSAQSPEVSS
jgi:hypothetical protein